MPYYLFFIALLSSAIYFTRRGISKNAYLSGIFSPIDYAELVKSVAFSLLILTILGTGKDSDSRSLIISFVFGVAISISLNELPIEARIGGSRFLNSVLFSIQNTIVSFLLFYILNSIFGDIIPTVLMIIVLSFFYRAKVSHNIIDYHCGLQNNEYITKFGLFSARKQCKQALPPEMIKKTMFYHAASAFFYSLIALICITNNISYPYPELSLAAIAGLFLGDFSSLSLNFLFNSYFNTSN